jgi:hypothetical protein
MSDLRRHDASESITNPTVFRAIVLLFPVIAERVSDRYGDEYSAENFDEVLKPLFVKLRKNDLQKPSGSHLDLLNLFRRRLESSFSIGQRRAT